MELNSTTAREFHDWINGKMTDENYLFQELSGTHTMIYGTGSAQIMVLAMMAMIAASIESGQYHILGMLPKEGLDELIRHFRDDSYHKSKTIFTQVSNFWLRKMQPYAMAKTKAVIGSTLDGTRLPSEVPRKLEKDKISAGKGVAAIHAEGEGVGGFYQRFSESPFIIDDVIAGRESYFTDSGSKARSQTTHGKDMKMSDLIFDASIRRSCKFQIYDSIREKRRVAYLLDDLDLSKVSYLSGKSGIPESARIVGGPSDGKVPICTTEIREIFRNWDYLKNHVKFYMNFRECAPPWDDGHGRQQEWARYANHRASNLLKDKASVLSLIHHEWLRMCQVNYDVRPAFAIESFHKARPSLYGKAQSCHVVVATPETF